MRWSPNFAAVCSGVSADKLATSLPIPVRCCACAPASSMTRATRSEMRSNLELLAAVPAGGDVAEERHAALLGDGRSVLFPKEISPPGALPPFVQTNLAQDLADRLLGHTIMCVGTPGAS